MNVHLTNSRYHTLFDLVRSDLMIRSGLVGRMRAAGMYPVLASSSIRFRRQVKPWQALGVTARILSWDERCVYMEHKLLVGDTAAAVGIVTNAFVDHNGRVSPERLDALMAHTGSRPPLTDVTAAKNDLDRLLSARDYAG